MKHIKKQRHYFANKVQSSQSYGFSCSHIWMWELDYKERWVLKNWCFWTVLLERTLESPLDCKESQPVNHNRHQSWIYIGRTDAEAEASSNTLATWCGELIHLKKNPDAGEYWRQEEKGTTEDEMVGWHHWFNGHEFQQTLGDGDGQGSLACCSPWGRKGSDKTERLNGTEPFVNLPGKNTVIIFKLHDSRCSMIECKTETEISNLINSIE